MGALQVEPQSEEAQFEYRPAVGDCQPQMWGEPVRATLTKDLADQFVHGFEQRQACAASHTTTRAKGTATFRLENSLGQTTAHFMLPYGDAQRPQWEALRQLAHGERTKWKREMSTCLCSIYFSNYLIYIEFNK